MNHQTCEPQLREPMFPSSSINISSPLWRPMSTRPMIREQLHSTFLIVALSLCLLTGLSFSIPAVALYRRTKEKQRGDRRIRFLAHHDALTGLENRASPDRKKLDKAFATLPIRGGCFAVHFIDLDRFKEVNDSLGHDGGDFLLTTIAERLRAVTRSGDVVARLGGDEFVVIQAMSTGWRRQKSLRTA